MRTSTKSTLADDNSRNSITVSAANSPQVLPNRMKAKATPETTTSSITGSSQWKRKAVTFATIDATTPTAFHPSNKGVPTETHFSSNHNAGALFLRSDVGGDIAEDGAELLGEGGWDIDGEVYSECGDGCDVSFEDTDANVLG